MGRRRRHVATFMIAGLLLTVASAVSGGTLTTAIGDIRVELASSPSGPRTNDQTEYVLRLVDAAGRPVTGAAVTLRGGMADGMVVVAPLRPGAEAGVYRGRLLFTMEGRWDLTLRVSHAGRRFELPLIELVAR